MSLTDVKITALSLSHKKGSTKRVIQITLPCYNHRTFFVPKKKNHKTRYSSRLCDVKITALFCHIKYDQLNTLFMSLTNVKITTLSLSHKNGATKRVIQITLPCYNHRTFFVPKKEIHKTRYSSRLCDVNITALFLSHKI